MHRKLILLLLLYTLSLSLALPQEQYAQIRIWSQDTYQTLGELGRLSIDMEGIDVRRDVYVDVQLSQSDIQRVEAAGLSIEERISDLSEYYAQQLLSSGSREFGLGSMGGYYTLDEIIESMDSLHAQYPHIVSARDSVGSSVEGRPIWAFKISDQPEVDEAEPEVFFNSLIHAREPAAMMTVMYYAWQLVENYDTDDLLTYLVNEREIWFMPVINPDGYVYNELTNPNGGGMHRKNMRPGCTSLPGVDLNRNWGYEWGYDDVGSSPDSCDILYRGSGPFSEPETQTIRDFIRSRDMSAVMNYHSYGNLLLRPFGFDGDAPLFGDDLVMYDELGADMTRENNYEYATGEVAINYNANGEATDYQYGELGIVCFVPEVGSWSEGGFWPPANMVMELAQENLSMNMHITGVSGSWVRVQELSLESEDNLEQGMDVGAHIMLRNKGLLSSEESVTLHLISPDTSIIPSQATFELGSIPSLSDFTLGPDDVSLYIATPSGSRATLILALEISEAYTIADTFQWSVGAPHLIWSEDFESGTDRWDSEDWDVVVGAHGGNYAYNESPFGDYPELSTVATVLRQGIDLRGYSSATLNFFAKWDIEIEYDFAQVLASLDGGTTWTALEGEHTVSGNGATVQPVGEPGYHGERDWQAEEMSLNQFVGHESVLLKMHTLSDTYYEGDGFVIDDMEVMAWGVGFFAGDVTRDGVVDISDVILALDWMIQANELSSDLFELTDMNQDATLDVRDLVIMVETALAWE